MASTNPPLSTARVTGRKPARGTSLGRRSSVFAYERVFIPSLVLDQTELLLRQAGIRGDEAFGVWAGTLAGGDAFVSSLVAPRVDGRGLHGEISADATAEVLDALDERDLVPILQLHSHPRRAFLSDIDAVRPLVCVRGFISIVVPSFGFVDLMDTTLWSVHEYQGPRTWRELTLEERTRRFVIDDSLIRIE